MSMADIVGWYDLEWSGGSFEVCFRPGCKFYCPRFQEASRWELTGDVVKVDWGRYGKYELTFTAATKSMDGYKVPKNEADEKNWRKAKFKRPLSAEEVALIGDGAGTEWDFQWSGGSFPVQFKADGYNHFKCQDFPAHAHWSLDGDKLKINWAEYGNYELTIDGASKTMSGCAVGGNPETDWRKAKLEKNLTDIYSHEECEHHH
mmetsp:Transcript_52492/g.125430  ORF Transcript_52492/g.125430 Transcript_52492/m.125430 type:complete len:204 (-) Transcript_52492:96-707(-)